MGFCTILNHIITIFQRGWWRKTTNQIWASGLDTEADSPPVLAAMPNSQRLLPVNDVLYTVGTDVAGTRARLVVDTGAEICWDVCKWSCVCKRLYLQKVISPNLFVFENLTFLHELPYWCWKDRKWERRFFSEITRCMNITGHMVCTGIYWW